MSVIRKKPYIQGVIESLTDLDSLQTILNSGGSNVSIDFNNIPQAESQAGYFENKSGIWLNYSDDNACFISYDKSQTLRLYDINLETHVVTKIDEYLSINELRTTLKDISGSGIEVDSALSGTSENPVQNKAINSAIDTINNTLTTINNTLSGVGNGTVTQLAEVPETPTSTSKTFIYVNGVLYVLVDDEYQGV